MSFLTKVTVTSDNNENLNLLIKVAPKVEEARKMMPLRAMFLREIYFYDTIIKKFDEFYKESNISKTSVNVPKCLKTIDEDMNEMLIMDNLKLKGYRMWNRKQQMDEEHVNLVFKKYARFHAVSYAMKNRKPDVFEEMTRNYGAVFQSETMSPEMYQKFITNSKDSCEKFFVELDEGTCKAIERYLENLEDFLLFVEKDINKNSVIIHGDCWCNNMLFKYEEKIDKPKDMCFLDFQLSRLASPILDLSYFFHVSAPKDILYNYKHHLMLYYKELKDHYLKLGGDPNDLLTFSDLLAEWKIYAKFGFTLALFIFKAMMCDEDEAQDFIDLDEKNIQLMDVFSGPMKNDNITHEMTKTLAIYMYDNDLF